MLGTPWPHPQVPQPLLKQEQDVEKQQFQPEGVGCGKVSHVNLVMCFHPIISPVEAAKASLYRSEYCLAFFPRGVVASRAPGSCDPAASGRTVRVEPSRLRAFPSSCLPGFFPCCHWAFAEFLVLGNNSHQCCFYSITCSMKGVGDDLFLISWLMHGLPSSYCMPALGPWWDIRHSSCCQKISEQRNKQVNKQSWDIK